MSQPKVRSAAYTDRLNAVLAYLGFTEKNAKTCSDITEHFGFSAPTSYNIVDVLVGDGHNVHETEVRRGARGALSKAYFVSKA